MELLIRYCAYTSAGWHQSGQKILLTGTVFEPDGKTSAANTLIYYYYTDTVGKYKHREDVKRSLPLNGMGHTDGYLRGWVKPDRNGRYSIYTVRPGSDPAPNVHAKPAKPG